MPELAFEITRICYKNQKRKILEKRMSEALRFATNGRLNLIVSLSKIALFYNRLRQIPAPEFEEKLVIAYES